LLFVLMHVYMLLNTFLSSRQESPVLLVGCGEAKGIRFSIAHHSIVAALYYGLMNSARRG